ncbi:Abnormal embryogenesis protein 30 [Caenorhabditis elegans]|uniref:Abnormal embryogenesis protein 30 n=1 Tax=Caenorhabditis elegans TaxID=6239 RepID=EMB30_CAEEL|nr:Abnormal embryogenesis protein 30 [Caenorhabditis elegans]P34441.4 RecName: Full=Abnormal embryogenesis protein 30 [Caenorhabditis elegans]AAF24233.1 emb-30 protein [Caenorhabditis elegans]CAA80159.3 Abnormal embryogenesis protein 30 [Caenorhabditis elegans]|eukprot:NP_499074.2 Abnormal embryogenesis protein 30 [Caenorhabditis elegans]
MDFSIVKTQILNNRRTFRTPFKVSSMCFSSQNDLIALGSKTGEILLKRTSWKMIWKTNINMIQAVGTECKLDSSVSALHFSPDGRFLAAATSKGIIHLLDVETGKVRFSVKAASEKIAKLHWNCVREKPFISNLGEFTTRIKNVEAIEGAIELAETTPNISQEEIAFVYQRLDEDGSSFKHEDAHKESLERTLISTETFRESLQNTILLATDDMDSKIIVLVAGVFPYMEIDISDTLLQYNQSLLMLYDMHYSSAFGGVSFLATTYGPFLDCKQNELKPPGAEPKKDGQGCHTLLFNVKLNINSSLWDTALRYIRLLFGFNLYSISLETTKRNWEEQIDNLHSLFDTKTKAVKIGNVLLEMLLSGSTDAAGEAFLERGLGTDGLDKIELFATKHMPEVCRIARGQLSTSARNLCFQRCEFSTSLSRYAKFIQLKDDDSFLYDEDPPAYLSESNIWLNTLEEKINILDMKTRHLGIQCLTMMQELGHLVKWISMTKPFAKTMKVNALMKIKRMNIAKILLYIVRNFIPDPEAVKDIENRLFNLKELVSKQKKKDLEDKFDEVEYLYRLERIAEVERKKLIETFHEKFRFADLDDDDLTPLLFQELDHPIDIFTDSMMEQNDSSPFLEEDEGEPEQEEQKPDEEPEPEGEPQPACDLDRVGSFFEKELSQKALEVLPKCDETFDCVLNERGSRMNSIEIQKMGILRVLEDLAATLSSPQKIHCDKAGNQKKLEVSFIYEITSTPTHQGYQDAKISSVTPSYYKRHPFNQLSGMGRSIQVSVLQKNEFSSIVIVPTSDVLPEDENEVNDHVEKLKRCYEFEKIDVTVDKSSAENRPPGETDAMEVDSNELRIDVDLGPVVPEYDTLIELSQVHPLHHGELVLLGKFTSAQEGTGVMSQMMRSISSYPHEIPEDKDVFAKNSSEDGSSEIPIETLIIHPTIQLAAYLHDDGSKITIGDMKPEVPPIADYEEKTVRKTFRDYQRRRERYREDMGVMNMNDVQYDVLVQEAMDSGRDLTDNGESDEDEEDDDI